MKWAVYYADGSRVTDAEATVETVPTRGVIAIAQDDLDVGRIILTGEDYYWFDHGWYAGDLFGLWDYLCRDGMKRVLFGRTIPTADFEAIMKRARTDGYLPVKSAGHGYRER